MQAITAHNIKTIMRPSYHIYRKPHKGEVPMKRCPLHGVTVYVHKNDLFDALEKYTNRDYVEVKVLTPDLIDFYGDGARCKAADMGVHI